MVTAPAHDAAAIARSGRAFAGCFWLGLLGAFTTVLPLEGFPQIVVQLSIWIGIVFCASFGLRAHISQAEGE